MATRLTPEPNLALGHQTVLLASRRYADRAREVLDGGADVNAAFALAYLTGLVDMGDLYARATYASSVESKLAEIDAHIEEELSGGISL